MKRNLNKIINLSLIVIGLLFINACKGVDKIDLTDYIYNKNYNLYDYVKKVKFEANGMEGFTIEKYIKIDDSLDSLIIYNHNLDVGNVTILGNNPIFKKIYEVYNFKNGIKNRLDIIDSVFCDYRNENSVSFFKIEDKMPNNEKFISTITTKIEFINDTLINNIKQNVVKFRLVTNVDILKLDSTIVNYMNQSFEFYLGLNESKIKTFMGNENNINSNWDNLKEVKHEVEYIPVKEFEEMLKKAGK